MFSRLMQAIPDHHFRIPCLSGDRSQESVLTKFVVLAFSSGVFSSLLCAARMRLSHSSTNWKMFASYSFWNRPNVGSPGLAALAARYSVFSRSVCDFGQAPRSIFCMRYRSHRQHGLRNIQGPAPNEWTRSATSRAGVIKAAGFPRCNSRREGEYEDIVERGNH